MTGTVDIRRYRDSLPTIPTPEVLEQRLVQEFEAREHTQRTPTAEPAGAVTSEADDETEASAIALDEPAADVAASNLEAAHGEEQREPSRANVDVDVDIEVELAAPTPPATSATRLPEADSPEPRARVAQHEPRVSIQEASAEAEQPETEEYEPPAEVERDSRSSETVPSARIKARRRRRLFPRLLMFSVLVGGLGAGYRYDPMAYHQVWQELQVRLSHGQQVVARTWLDGRRSLGF